MVTEDENEVNKFRSVCQLSSESKSGASTQTANSNMLLNPDSQSPKATTEHPSSSPDKYYTMVYFQGKDKIVLIKAEIDMGSIVTIVMEVMHMEHFSYLPMKPLTMVLSNFVETPAQGIRDSIGVTVFYVGKYCIYSNQRPL